MPGDVERHGAGDAVADVGAPASFGAFTPGVARDYRRLDGRHRDLDGRRRDARGHRPERERPGRLVNGAFALAQPLRRAPAPAAFAPIGGSPLTLKSYAAPISNDAGDARLPAVDRLQRAAAHGHATRRR